MDKQVELITDKRAGLLATLTNCFDTATLIILRFDAGTTPKEKEKELRLLIIRATVRGAKKYVTGRVYAADGELKAFHVFIDIDAETGETVCKRWKIGPHEVKTVNMRSGETFQTELFINNPVPYMRRLYKPCDNLWRMKNE